jgi:hypothetical protein
MYKLLTIIYFSFLLIISSSAIAQVEVSRSGYGIYSSRVYDGGGYQLKYKVDTIARICFAITIYGQKNGGGIGVTEISCSNLAKRDEWKEIITWERELSNSE